MLYLPAICDPKCHQNNGYCKLPGECHCPQGYEGPNCETPKYSRFCNKNHAVSYSPENNCICNNGFSGQNCQINQNFCETNNPCLNGGLCSNTVDGGFECVCRKNFYGRSCELSANEISKKTKTPTNVKRTYCSNHGTLNLKTNNCDCDKFYFGPKCSIHSSKNYLPKLHNNQENPCGNGGIYLGKKSSSRLSAIKSNNYNSFEYKCRCLDGFYGQNCVSGSFRIGGKIKDKSFSNHRDKSSNNAIVEILIGMVLLFLLIIVYLTKTKLKSDNKSRRKTTNNKTKSPPNNQDSTNCQILLPESNIRLNVHISTAAATESDSHPQNDLTQDPALAPNQNLLRPPPYSKIDDASSHSNDTIISQRDEIISDCDSKK